MEDGTVWMVPGGYENYGKRSPEQKCSGFFMHTGTQRKDVSRADGCPAHGVGKVFPTQLHSPVQKKYAAKAAHGGIYC